MRDFKFAIKQDKKRLVVHTLYLPDTHIWEIFIDVPIENALYEHKYMTNDTKAVPIYDTMQELAENVYHDEAWSIDAGEVWDWIEQHELNLTFAGQGDETHLYSQGEREFYNDSDDGYFALASWITDWVNEHFILLDS